VITSIDISSTSGIKQMKHFEVSGASAIPESSTWAMLALGFAALGFRDIGNRGRAFRSPRKLPQLNLLEAASGGLFLFVADRADVSRRGRGVGDDDFAEMVVGTR
jgi:hypothetical protein